MELDLFSTPEPVKPKEPVILTVSELTSRIRDVLEDQIGEVTVTGEISNFRNPGSGHLYFTLKDEGATLAAVMFRGDAGRLGFTMKDGQAVVARGLLTVYEARGQYQIRVLSMQTKGLGSLQERFEALKLKLAAEGLFDLERKRPLPVFPESIGIITSLQGAVLQDMRRVLARRAPGIRLFVRGVRVQGTEAAPEIVEAIQDFNREARVDVLIVARGGGSIEDLWPFNEEIVARALAASSIPTISAVGHETDFTIADFVADLRAPTPSAAAELVSRDWAEWREELAQWLQRLTRASRQNLESHQTELRRLRDNYVFREPRRVVEQYNQRIDDLRDDLRTHLAQAARERRHQLETLLLRWRHADPRLQKQRKAETLSHLEARLQALSPQATLNRGFALVTDSNGQLLRKATPGLKGRDVTVRLAHGQLSATVNQVQPMEKAAPSACAP
jgi:exodeoxyribonuclease VII large subunit